MGLMFNAIKTPDGTILISRHRHDFVSHLDTLTNKTYAVDGGLSYQRVIGPRDYENLSLYDKDSFEKKREFCEWGKLLENGSHKYIKIKDLETDHIEAILETQHRMRMDFRELLSKELASRKDK